MTDWKLVAAARNLGIPDADLEKISPVMDALEAGFRPLVQKIPLLAEPAVTFCCLTEEGAEERS